MIPYDVLRLEVETDPAPGELVNLVVNPSGEMGAFGWLSPVEGSRLIGEVTSTGPRLRYVSATFSSGSNYFQTESMTVAPGEYVAARWHMLSTPHNRYRVRLDWHNAADGYISSSSWLTFTGPGTTSSLSAVVAPASAQYVRLRFEVGGSAAFPYNKGGRNSILRNVIVAKAATVEGFRKVSRTNLATNPSAETNTNSWIAGVTRTTAGGAAFGSYALQTATTGTAFAAKVPVTAGEIYTASVYARAIGAASEVKIRFRWYSDSTELSISGYATAAINSSTFSRVAIAAPAPPGADGCTIDVNLNAGTAYIDGLLVEQRPLVGAYFDGSSAGSLYGWTGTAHGSASVYGEPYGALDDLSPVPYVNILGPATELKIVRGAANVGTVSAVVLDADLDPAVEPLIRPGRRARVMALTEADVWEQVVGGTMDTASVSYDLLRLSQRPGDKKYARIDLSIVDAVQQLAGSIRPDGVNRVVDLPGVLEGCGVPWVVDGNSNHVVPGSGIKTEGASALDQIILTIDAAAGYWWTDRFGVLQCWSNLVKPYIEHLPNGTFETDIAGWEPWNASSDLARSLTYSRTGDACMRILHSASAASSGAMSEIPVTPGVNYYLALYVRSTGTRVCQLGGNWYDADDALISTASFGNINSNASGWTAHTDTITAPANAASLRVIVTFEGFPGDINYVDDVTLREYIAPPVLDEDDYSALDVAFSLDDLVNEVAVKTRVMKKGDAIEVPYGPFRNNNSIATWGRRRAEYTVQGIKNTKAAAQAYADGVLANHATPEVTIRSVTLPIRERTDIAKALLDLYDQVQILNAAKGLDKILRVTEISHDITPTKWLATFTLKRELIRPRPRKNKRISGAGRVEKRTISGDEVGVLIDTQQIVQSSGSYPSGSSGTRENTITVNFDPPFVETPMVSATINNGTTANGGLSIAVGSVSKDSVNVNCYRATGAGAYNVRVVATGPI